MLSPWATPMTELSDRLRHLAHWLRIEAPLLPPAVQMAELAEAARTLDALVEEVRKIEKQERLRERNRYYAADIEEISPHLGSES